ncbi:MAG TPA: riboflavin synthase [Longimicrobiales bacterium]|nr:riboflavin synthase [Longimicrobiales bacterium]
MFTGIVQEVGTVIAAEPRGGLLRLTIGAGALLGAARPGDSIAVDGTCLTIVRCDASSFDVEVMPTTLERTTLPSLAVGQGVNLERALAAGEPLGGHIVQGHVDGTGEVVRIERGDDAVLMDVAVPDDVFGVTVLRGSITLAGVSLTVSALPRPGVVRVSLIPFTLEHTTLGALREGAVVNVEADLLARLVAEQTRRWLDARAGAGAADAETGREAVEETHGIR